MEAEMKHLLILITLLVGIAASTSSCCFNPFFYVPFEELDVSETESQPPVRVIESDTASPETSQEVFGI